MPIRDSIKGATVMSLYGTDWRFVGSDQGMDRLFIQGSVLTLQRNLAVHKMRGHFLIFIDDDMTFKPDAIGNLVDTFFELDHQFDEPIIVGGLCFRRQPPYQPTLYMRQEAADGGYRFLEQWNDDIVEVDATGCAFLLIPKTALEAIAESDMPPWEMREHMGGSPNFFRWDGRAGEDLTFCQDFKAKGGRIFVDTRIQVGHLSELEVGFYEYLTQVALRDPVDEERSKTINERMGLPTMTREEARKRLGWQ